MWNKLKRVNLPYLILSVCLAILLWAYVDVTVKPDTRISIHAIEVNMVGEDKLEEQGLMIADSKPHTITLTIVGPRSVVSQLNRSNVTVSVDLASQVTSAGRKQLEYSIRFPSTVNLSNIKISRSASSIEAEIVKYSTKTIRIETKFSGSVAKDYLCDEDDFAVSPSELTIHGEESLVQSVSHAVVELDAADLDSTWTGELPVVLVGMDGSEIDPKDLELSAETVQGVFPVRHYKDVPLTVELISGGGATKEDVTNWKLTPSTIRVIGTEEKLEKLDSLSLGEIHLEDVITSFEEEFEIVLPSGVTHADDQTKATLSFELSSKLETQTITTDKILLNHVPEGYTAELDEPTLSVDIRGEKDSMKLLRPEYVTVEADLSGVEAKTGGITVPATVKVKGMSDVGVMGEYSLTLYLDRTEE